MIKKAFDLKVHHYDEKGKMISSNPYIRHVSRDKGVIYERNGKFFYENDGENEVPAEQNWVKPVKVQAAPAPVETSKGTK